MPVPSAPMTMTVGTLRSISYSSCSASPAVPTIQRPRCCSCWSVRARLVTATKGTVSAAPQATLRTVGDRLADLSRGMITACAPAASALRRQAPRLCGSVTPASTSSKGTPSYLSSRCPAISSDHSWLGETLATTRCCTPPPASLSNSSGCTRSTSTDSLAASSSTAWMRASNRPRCTSSCRTRRGARSSTACTACRPYTCSSLIDDVAYLLLVLRLRGPAEGLSPPLPPL